MNNQERTFENKINQITAHIAKIHIVTISRFLTASMIVSYIHNNTSMKLPEIPGKIIAQIAMEPQISVHRRVDVIERGVFEGFVMKKAKIQNIIRQRIVFQSRLTCFPRNTAEIRINPMKNDRISMG